LSTTEMHAAPDLATIERLSTAFNRCFETLDAGEEVFAPDAFFDLYPPFWRFQLQGPDGFAAQLRAVAEGTPTARLLRVVPTATGFVMEHEQTQRGARVEVARRLWLCEVRDGRITEVVGYCNGGWDDELRARHAAEAPMLRP
jgi:ketosteroid isomerase-like protein